MEVLVYKLIPRLVTGYHLWFDSSDKPFFSYYSTQENRNPQNIETSPTYKYNIQYVSIKKRLTSLNDDSYST